MLLRVFVLYCGVPILTSRQPQYNDSLVIILGNINYVMNTLSYL